ncbi:MAG: leucine-rich repeat domain-containing protein [Lachnospiraceae bacterium]|nr:leucine-rich repeat domain-containing protein [Lachnospiraceae bacterium]
MEAAEKIVENTGGGQLCFTLNKNAATLKRYRGIAEKVEIPESVTAESDVCSVTAIERKAFLSCKTIKEISLPDTIEELGDWAFAHTEKLRTVTIPNHALARGKELFLGCARLREIRIRGLAGRAQADLPRMLAIAVTALHDYVLFNPPEVGSDAWVSRWDAKLLELIRLDDLDGYEELWTCGEEDYEGKEYDIKSYPVEKRKMKLRIVYFRLLNPYKLSEESERALKEYLRESAQSWEIIMEEHADELEYYRLFADAGCITRENFDALLTALSDCSAEIKAYLLKYKDEHFGASDAFAAFELDW